MKFNWGTGILIFMIVFVLANAVFMIFAFRQEVSLVEDDYYEKGVDYGEHMEVLERSAKFEGDVKTSQDGEYLYVRFKEELYSGIDSGDVVLFRPSSGKYDIEIMLKPHMEEYKILRNDLIRGRYILKMDWYTDGLQYELNMPLSIQ